jgi:hypothetical protein
MLVFCNGRANYGVSTGANSGLDSSGGRLFYAMAKTVCFLNKQQN